MVPATRERARPLLGTIVSIRIAEVHGADRAIDAAFAEIATVHRLMSFQEPGSDLGRIARAGAGQTVALDPRTRECLDAALAWARLSEGVFDPVAAVDGRATWQDLSLTEEGAHLTRPLLLDLSGIAKGYAVDRACTILAQHGCGAGIVDAGGDLRVIGEAEEEIALRPSFPSEPAIIALADGALASSDTMLARGQHRNDVHLDGQDRKPVADQFVAVAAPVCADADALTKIVLTLGERSEQLLRSAGAVAYRFDAEAWSAIGVKP